MLISHVLTESVQWAVAYLTWTLLADLRLKVVPSNL